MELQGQVAIVTGGSRGIGRAVVQRLAQDGAAVLLGYQRQADAARHLVAELERTGAQVLALQGDVADPAYCEALVQTALERFGRLDILVNNAGHSQEELLLDTTVEAWDRLMAVHLRGLYACSRAALKPMVNQRYGRIVAVSSIWGISGAAGEVAYSAAKAGQIGFTKALAQEVGALGITVNAVAPGAIATDMNAGLTGEALEDWLERTPVGRLGTAEEVADVIRFLVGQGAGFITGQVWSPNGGIL